MRGASQPWIYSRRLDMWFIIGPAFLITGLVLALQGWWQQLETIPPWLWLLLILGVDVTHVYSTLYRTYLDKQEMQQRAVLYLLTPLLAWLLGYWLYISDDELFWRVVAYLAIFHFVRQQYGFMMIYGRNDPRHYKWLDKLAIYAATVYPLIYWHCNRRDFYWMAPGDIIQFGTPLLNQLALSSYCLIMAAYLLKEFTLWRQTRQINWPRNLMLLGTAISWMVGIVVLNHDLAFTAINVIAHGIPYMALIWVYGRNQAQLQGSNNSWYFTHTAKLFQPAWTGLFIGIIFMLAYLEESLWDAWVWQESHSVLPLSYIVDGISNPEVLAGLVPLLAVPQLTHYVLDAYIWRLQTHDTPWKQILFLNAK